MKATKFTEMSSLEWQEAYASVKNAINESIKVCSLDCVSSYKDMDLDTYWDSLIAECWYEKDGEECHCDGFSIISQYILVEDEKDEEGLRDMFNDARNEVYDNFLQDLSEKIIDCECEDFSSEVEEHEEGGYWLSGYDSVTNADRYFSEELSELWKDLGMGESHMNEFAGYTGHVKAETSDGTWYFKKN